MKPSIDHVRELALKIADLRDKAHSTHQNIFAAADAECARLTRLIDRVSQADVLTDDDKSSEYQSWVMQRAGLLRLLEGHHA